MHNSRNVFGHLGNEVDGVIVVERVAIARVCKGQCIKKL